MFKRLRLRMRIRSLAAEINWTERVITEQQLRLWHLLNDARVARAELHVLETKLHRHTAG